MAAIISASVRVEECRSIVTGLSSPSSRYEMSVEYRRGDHESSLVEGWAGTALPPRIVRESEASLVTLMSPKALLQPAAQARHGRSPRFGFADVMSRTPWRFGHTPMSLFPLIRSALIRHQHRSR